jgi:hypothetical protein
LKVREEAIQTRAPSRAMLGGLSLLLVVAFAFQASNPLGLKAASRTSPEAVLRMVVEASVRAEVRAVRRDEHRPDVASRASRADAALRMARADGLRGGEGATAPVVRRPLVRVTSLPPPRVG